MPSFSHHQFAYDTSVFDACVKWGGLTYPVDVQGPAGPSSPQDTTTTPSAYFTHTVYTTDPVNYPWSWTPDPTAAFSPITQNHRP